MDSIRVKIGSNGRFVIPVVFRKALGVREGDELLVRVVDDELRVSTAKAAINQAQARVRHYVPADTRLVDELIRERRRAAEEEL